MRAFLILALLPSIAAADVATDLTARLEAIASKSTKTTSDTPQFAFTSNVLVEKPASLDEATFGLPEIALAQKGKVSVGSTGDVAFISANLDEFAYCAKPRCPNQTAETQLRATVLFEKANNAWQPLAWSITPPINGNNQVLAIAQKIFPDVMGKDLGGADEPAKAFETALADPKLLGAMVSARKEVVLYGSELPERWATGATVKSQLASWGIGFKPRDGMRAGLSKSGTFAWVAANVDGSFVKLKRPPVPYRVFAILEKTGKDWKIVALQFSTAV